MKNLLKLLIVFPPFLTFRIIRSLQFWRGNPSLIYWIEDNKKANIETFIFYFSSALILTIMYMNIYVVVLYALFCLVLIGFAVSTFYKEVRKS